MMAEMRVNKNSIGTDLVVVGVFIFSMLLAPYYVLGDQRTYTGSYESMAGTGLLEGALVYAGWFGPTPEIMHFLVSWVGSNLDLGKIVVMSASNAILALLFMKLFNRWKVSIYVSSIIMLTNFYFYGLYFAAERLKFGFIFLAASLLLLGQHRKFFFTAALAVFGHVQILVFYGTFFFKDVFREFLHAFKTLKLSYRLMIVVGLLLGLVGLIGNYLYFKVMAHAGLRSGSYLFDVSKILLFVFLALAYSKNWFDTILVFVPVVFLVLILGPDRINMIGYFVFMYFGLQYKNGLNFGVLITSLYYLPKSIFFVVEVIQTGRAYAPNFSPF